MVELFNQGWLGSLLGLLGFIFGLIGLILYRNSKIGARPTCHLKSLRLIGKEEQELPQEVEIQYKDISVPRLTLTQVYLWNDGKEIVQGNQVVEDDPLRFEFDASDEILKAHVGTVTRDVNKVHVDVLSDIRNVAKLSFDYLDPGDGARIELLHTSKRRYPKILGSIRGIPKGLTILTPSRQSPINKAISNILQFRNTILISAAILGGIALIAGFLPSSILLKIKGFMATKSSEQGNSVSDLRTVFIATGTLYTLMPLSVFLRMRKKYPASLDADKEKDAEQDAEE